MVNFLYITVLMMLVCLAERSAGQENFWHKSFTGIIDKYPFTLHLQKADHQYAGYYYYNKTQRPFAVTGSDTANAGEIRLLTWVPDSDSDNELFILTLRGDSLAGEWKKDPTATTAGLPVKAKTDETFLPVFDLVYVSGEVKLRPKMEQSPMASYEASVVWPRGNTPAVTTLKKLINADMGFRDTQADIGPLLLADKKSFLAGYLSDNKTVADSDLVNYPSAYSQDASNKIEVIYHSRTILSLARSTYAYTGGAHGNYGTSFLCIHPATGKPYTLSMVLSEAGKKKLNGLLEKSFRRDRKLSDKEPLTEAGLFENKITATDNFYLTGTGITFNYTPYEIAPYAMGEVIVFIPYSEFGSGGLNPSFKK